MNDAQLTEQLRALRQPAPDGGFEARLQQALWREAQALRAERTLARPAPARRLLRWAGRLGAGVAITLGATAAAAAAGGIWALIVERTPAPAVLPAAPAVEATAGAARRTAGPLPRLVTPGNELGAAPSAPLVEPSAAEAVHGAPRAPVQTTPLRTAEPPAQSVPAPGAARASRKPGAAAPARSSDAPPAVREPAAELLPFDLPEPGKAAPAPRAADRSGAPERPARPELERRARPEVPARGEARRARPERPGRERGAWPPGREIARERSGRDNAERGLDRAREARERKK